LSLEGALISRTTSLTSIKQVRIKARKKELRQNFDQAEGIIAMGDVIYARTS